MNPELLRQIIQFAVSKAREITDDQEALRTKFLYKEFDKQIGRPLVVGEYIQYKDNLYKVIQAHTAQQDWTPDVAASLFTVIDLEHAGTLNDPIPAKVNMEYFNGKYYIEGDTVYLCTRDSGTALHYLPSALVGHYFQIV